MANYSVYDIANWYLSKDEMSPKKLQKMVYYAYAWYLTIKNEPTKGIESKLFSENIEAWVHGPVVPELYRKYKPYGYNDIPKVSLEKVNSFEEDTEDVLNQVYEVYGKYNGNQLESISHQEDPWISARVNVDPLESCSNVITDEKILSFYSKRVSS